MCGSIFRPSTLLPIKFINPHVHLPADQGRLILPLPQPRKCTLSPGNSATMYFRPHVGVALEFPNTYPKPSLLPPLCPFCPVTPTSGTQERPNHLCGITDSYKDGRRDGWETRENKTVVGAAGHVCDAQGSPGTRGRRRRGHPRGQAFHGKQGKQGKQCRWDPGPRPGARHPSGQERPLLGHKRASAAPDRPPCCTTLPGVARRLEEEPRQWGARTLSPGLRLGAGQQGCTPSLGPPTNHALCSLQPSPTSTEESIDLPLEKDTVTGRPNQVKIQLPGSPTGPNALCPQHLPNVHPEWHSEMHPGVRGHSLLPLAAQ